MEKSEEVNYNKKQSPFKMILTFISLFAVRMYKKVNQLQVRTFSALYNTIPDADDTFNFWEPTHYLAFNFGLQTWEYRYLT